MDSMSVRNAHPSLKTFFYKRAAGLKTFFDRVPLDAELALDRRGKESKD